jgi:hypothetical protein
MGQPLHAISTPIGAHPGPHLPSGSPILYILGPMVIIAQYTHIATQASLLYRPPLAYYLEHRLGFSPCHTISSGCGQSDQTTLHRERTLTMGRLSRDF